ncbi:MAG TPA: TIGR03862 family flavoprotein [Gammaproteobacteria bacterium]
MSDPEPRTVAVIGGGPAGLMAAEALSRAGVRVDLFDAMPSVGRKFLLAGRGGLNITHSEPLEPFLSRYGTRREQIAPLLERFGPEALRTWIHRLGIETFVGSSGRVFPREMKAAPLLRAWLHRLREAGVRFHVHHRWCGWRDGALLFRTPEGERLIRADAVVLALGGGSWKKFGSDGGWVPTLQQQGIAVAPLQPANCGFEVQWSAHLRQRFSGSPVKPAVIRFRDAQGAEHQRQGEFVLTEHGIEGGLVYALSAPLRDTIAVQGAVTIFLDLLPGLDAARVLNALSRPRGTKSLSNHLRGRLGIDGVKAGLLYEVASREQLNDPQQLAPLLKALPLTLVSTRPMDEAISTAGGVCFETLDEHLMVRNHPGLFCAGEMLDWEAPTGGYLLTACFASGLVAGEGAALWLDNRGRGG